MAFKEYPSFDGIALGELVRKREVKAEELLDEAITRLEKHNGVLNAVVYKAYDIAREAAKRISLESGPFTGVPFLLKDILGDCEGMPTRFGSRYIPPIPMPIDSELVARYKRAGLIPFGKTNVPEAGLTPFTESQLYGPARNPWNPEYTPGGSSGGSAAAVASGIVPLAHGNDGGGSIRIPASCCGLVGFKPTRGRNSLAPMLGDAVGGLVVEHVLTRTVRDSAAALDATEGYVPGDPHIPPKKTRPYVEEVSTPPGKLKIGFSTQRPAGGTVHPDCVAATEAAAKLCIELGHHVEEATFTILFDEVSSAMVTVFAAACAFTIDSVSRLLAIAPTPDAFETLTWKMYELGRQTSASQYLGALAILHQASRTFARLFESYDVFLTPTTGTPPLRIGEVSTTAPDASLTDERIVNFVHLAPIYNITGQPAVSLPLYWNDQGLPIGVTFGARFGEEGLLFRLAGQIERAQPWTNRRPKIWD